jgi:hypothetical protein
MLDPFSAAVWLDWADRAYVSARLLWFTEMQIEAPLHAHRALELYLKTYLVGCGDVVAKGQPAWGHRLPDLADAAARYDISFREAELVRRLAFFERFFRFTRYPTEPGSPEDGSLVWFSFDANILPLDECVAHVRPRVTLKDEEWSRSYLATQNQRGGGFPHRALVDGNSQLGNILCGATTATQVDFTKGFRYDLRRC